MPPALTRQDCSALPAVCTSLVPSPLIIPTADTPRLALLVPPDAIASGVLSVRLVMSVFAPLAAQPIELRTVAAVVKAGAAVEPVKFPKAVLAAAVLSENVSAGVVVVVDSDVVNSGDKSPAEKSVTVPPLDGEAHSRAVPLPLTRKIYPAVPMPSLLQVLPALPTSRSPVVVVAVPVPPAVGISAPLTVRVMAPLAPPSVTVIVLEPVSARSLLMSPVLLTVTNAWSFVTASPPA